MNSDLVTRDDQRKAFAVRYEADPVGIHARGYAGDLETHRRQLANRAVLSVDEYPNSERRVTDCSVLKECFG